MNSSDIIFADEFYVIYLENVIEVIDFQIYKKMV